MCRIVHARNRVVKDGIVINGLPIINDRPDHDGSPRLPNLDLYYADCVIGGPGSFVSIAHGIKDFARAICQKMVLEICCCLTGYSTWIDDNSAHQSTADAKCARSRLCRIDRVPQHLWLTSPAHENQGASHSPNFDQRLASILPLTAIPMAFF